MKRRGLIVSSPMVAAGLAHDMLATDIPAGPALTLRGQAERDLRVLRAHRIAFADPAPQRVAWLAAEVPPHIKRVP